MVSLLAGLTLMNVGCSSLLARPDDSRTDRAKKTFARVLIGIPTLGISEAFFGPAQRRQNRRRAENSFQNSMDALIGRLSLDEAVSTYGVPTARYDGERTVVAEWRTESRRTVASPVGNSVVARSVQSGELMRLTFDRYTSLLQKWSYHRY